MARRAAVRFRLLYAPRPGRSPGDGRAWVGNFGFDLMGGAPASTTVLICVEPDGTAKVAADELGFPNGMVLTPDGRTLVAALRVLVHNLNKPLCPSAIPDDLAALHSIRNPEYV